MKSSKKLKLQYDAKHHKKLPHVVKFSGGRSSGMMLVALLEQGLLKAERGDVIVFNNTSAEHPATYEFVRKCTRLAETQYGVPFFWTEYTSYEDSYNGDWKRHISYRLVKPKPYSEECPDGFHYRGEAFEEMISQQGFLPSRHTRNCTAHLKLGVTTSFLSEWFAAKSETMGLGHYYDESQVSDESLYKAHVKSRGKFSRDEFLQRKQYVRSCPLRREAQQFSDFSKVGSKPMCKGNQVHSLGRDFVQMRGKDAFEFVSVMGLRVDEPRRVVRVKQRNELDPDSQERKNTGMSDGEVICTPLADSGITKEDIQEFWVNRPKREDLKLPHQANLSNCVYCFMKGTNALSQIIRDRTQTDKKLPEKLRSVDMTPSDINWWIDIEGRYQRVADKRYAGTGRRSKKKVVMGFWGMSVMDEGESNEPQNKSDRLNYKSIYDNSEELMEYSGVDSRPCDCTD